MNNKIIIDLDDTLTFNSSSSDYSRKSPRKNVIKKLFEFRDLGYEIVVYTARNQKTYNGSIGKITKNTVPIILDWLKAHNVPFDELIVGKPWCGPNGFIVDDRAIRPDEFINLSQAGIETLLKNEK
jgi:capsule biosynthesis phosphatase